MIERLEEQFVRWASPPPPEEGERCERTVRAIREAVEDSSALRIRSTLVFPQGSYRNRVNVRRESDVDVGVLCDETFFSHYPDGLTRESFGYSPATYGFSQFKTELEDALVRHFGRPKVTRGNKAFDIKSPGHIEADVVPFFEYRWHYADRSYVCGVALQPERGSLIHNYPEILRSDWPSTPLHYENGVAKNTETRRAFKGSVRILKHIREEMADRSIRAAQAVPRYLLECLVWNVPNQHFLEPTWADRTREVLFAIWHATGSEERCRDWTEVDGLKFLFHGSQPWTLQQAHEFADSAWLFLGLPRT